jgi:hypothetical protein
MSELPTKPQRSTLSRVPAYLPTDPEFKGRLMDEYKMLQDKIDKIGGFRSTIKGWSVTIVIAAAAATASSSSLLTVLMISVGLGVMLTFFCKFEYDQVKLSRLFGDRARKLEETFNSLDRVGSASKLLIPVPFTAHEIVQAGYKQKLLHAQAARRVGNSIAGKVKNLYERWRERWPVLKQSDVRFYIALISLAFLLLLGPRYKSVYGHFKKFVDKPHHSERAPRSGESLC